MCKDLMLFKNEKFGKIRMVKVKGKPYAIANDVAKALGYVECSKAIRTHCKGVSEMDIPTNGGIQKMKVIPQGDILRLAVKCQLDGAEEFESWIFDEVIPDVLNDGGYISSTATTEQVEKLVEKHYKQRDIKNIIMGSNYLNLEDNISKIMEYQLSLGKKERYEYHKKLNSTEYKQFIRQYVLDCVDELYNNTKDPILSLLCYKIATSTFKDVLETNNRSWSHK